MKQRRVLKAMLMVASVLVLLAVFQSAADACPTCKDGLAEGEENVARGYFWSILFMMGMPFLIFAGMALYFFLAVRRARARQVATAAASCELPVTADHFASDDAHERAEELVEV